VANELLADFPQGAWLVQFAPISDPTLVPYELADALGLHEAGESKLPILELIVDYLRPRKTLLLFDNCEHLVEAIARLADTLLKDCKDLSILATSREALRLDGEAAYRLPSLGCPRPDAELDTLLESESVRLFVDRARDSAPGFGLKPAEASAIAKICRHLDGIPLALELAAARVNMMTVAEIAERLEDRFRLLTDGTRTSLPRQKTLRASIDWSYNLLAEAEKILLTRLSVFSGGWTLPAMEKICAGDALAASEILDLVGHLLDKSLIMADQGEGGTRYRMLETVREYAAEKLAEAGEEAARMDCHLEYFVEMAEVAEPKLQGADQTLWFDRLESEKDNLRAALKWSLKSGRIESGLRLAAALFSFWDNKGYWSEGYRRLSALLEREESGNELVRAKALVAAGSLASDCGYIAEMSNYFEKGLQILRNQGQAGRQFLGFALAQYAKAYIDRDLGQGCSIAAEAVQASREAGDPLGLAYSLWAQSMMVRRLSDFESARAAEEESMHLFEKLGNHRYHCLLMSNLAWTYYFQGDLDQSRETFDRSINLAREIGDRYSEANSIPGRADISRRSGKYEQAEALLQKGLAYHREIGSAHQGLVNHLHIFGLLELSRGDLAKAQAYLQEGVRAAGKGNLLHFLRFVIDALAYVFAAGAPLRAAQLFGAAEMLRAHLGTQLYPVELGEYGKYQALARDQLAKADWNSAWMEGRSMTVEQTLQLALEAD